MARGGVRRRGRAWDRRQGVRHRGDRVPTDRGPSQHGRGAAARPSGGRRAMGALRAPGACHWVLSSAGAAAGSGRRDRPGDRRVADGLLDRTGAGSHPPEELWESPRGGLPSCAETYRGDAYQLVAAGMRGGKGVPESVSEHPTVFVTLTAPSFGPVHSRRMAGDGPKRCRPRRVLDVCPHGVRLSCGEVTTRTTVASVSLFVRTASTTSAPSCGMRWFRSCGDGRRCRSRASSRAWRAFRTASCADASVSRT